MTVDGSGAKQWEVRAALRAMARSRESSSRRNPAEALVAAANEIVAESDDFTVKHVSERAGVALQTFYRHFGSKDELILAMLEELVIDGVDRIMASGDTADPWQRLKVLVQAPFTEPVTDEAFRSLNWRVRERQRLSQRFPREVQAVYEPYRVAVADALQRGKDAGVIESEDPALDAVLIQQQVSTSYYMLSSHGTEYGPEQFADRVWELTWRALAAEPDDAPMPASLDGRDGRDDRDGR